MFNIQESGYLNPSRFKIHGLRKKGDKRSILEKSNGMNKQNRMKENNILRQKISKNTVSIQIKENRFEYNNQNIHSCNSIQMSMNLLQQNINLKKQIAKYKNQLHDLTQKIILKQEQYGELQDNYNKLLNKSIGGSKRHRIFNECNNIKKDSKDEQQLCIQIIDPNNSLLDSEEYYSPKQSGDFILCKNRKLLSRSTSLKDYQYKNKKIFNWRTQSINNQ